MKTPDELNFTQLNAWLDTRYTLESAVHSSLLRSHTNDVYLVTTATSQYILKIYGINWRTESDIKYELALLEHLARKGVPVANAVAGRNEQKLHKFRSSRGEQLAVLFKYADGHKPQPPFSTDLYMAFGQAIATMHNGADDFVTTYPRKPLDLITIIETPLKLALPLTKDADDRIFLEKVARIITDKMELLIPQGLDWGAIHGDATLDNLHVTANNRIVLYDFDSGGLGWRAADLQGWAFNNAPYLNKWQAFKEGYTSVRELKPHNLEAARYLAVAWLIWGLQIDLENRVLAQGRAKTAEYLAMQISAIKNQTKRVFG